MDILKGFSEFPEEEKVYDPLINFVEKVIFRVTL